MRGGGSFLGGRNEEEVAGGVHAFESNCKAECAGGQEVLGQKGKNDGLQGRLVSMPWIGLRLLVGSCCCASVVIICIQLFLEGGLEIYDHLR